MKTYGPAEQKCDQSGAKGEMCSFCSLRLSTLLEEATAAQTTWSLYADTDNQWENISVLQH